MSYRAYLYFYLANVDVTVRVPKDRALSCKPKQAFKMSWLSSGRINPNSNALDISILDFFVDYVLVTFTTRKKKKSIKTVLTELRFRLHKVDRSAKCVSN